MCIHSEHPRIQLFIELKTKLLEIAVITWYVGTNDVGRFWGPRCNRLLLRSSWRFKHKSHSPQLYATSPSIQKPFSSLFLSHRMPQIFFQSLSHFITCIYTVTLCKWTKWLLCPFPIICSFPLSLCNYLYNTEWVNESCFLVCP